jgi:hypothetical protein
LIAGVSAELIVPDSRAATLRVGGRKYGDSGADVAVVGGVFEVVKAALVDIFFGTGVSCIEHVEFRPKKATDAADAIAPSEAASVAEFWVGKGVSSGFADCLSDLLKTSLGGRGSSFFRFQ